MSKGRIFSGMQPSGRFHLGNYLGALDNWIKLQDDYECFFSSVDLHALTSTFENTSRMRENVMQMALDWLSAGLDPEKNVIFLQSHVPAHAELHLLLSMMTPLGWLERVPTYKDQQEKMSNKDLSTYGFLGYPLLMSADILIYRADKVPVGEDQIPHVEITRELARRFNHMYGREPGFEEKAKEAVKKLGSKNARFFEELRKAYQQDGNADAVARGKAVIAAAQSLSAADRERLLGHLEGTGKMILVEPGYLLTEASKMPGLDGQKMSKSYNNTITLREDEASVTQKIKRMPTDTNRVRRTDPGDPERCPVWQLHQVYSDEACKDWVQKGCRSAGIGCIECKQPVIDGILAEQAPMRERAQRYLDNPKLVREIVAEGNAKASALARETMRDVRASMGLSYA